MSFNGGRYNMKDNKILIGYKGEDKYKNYTIHPSTWTTIQKIHVEHGEIKVWNRWDNIVKLK